MFPVSSVIKKTRTISRNNNTSKTTALNEKKECRPRLDFSCGETVRLALTAFNTQQRPYYRKMVPVSFIGQQTTPASRNNGHAPRVSSPTTSHDAPCLGSMMTFASNTDLMLPWGQIPQGRAGSCYTDQDMCQRRGIGRGEGAHHAWVAADDRGGKRVQQLHCRTEFATRVMNLLF